MNKIVKLFKESIWDLLKDNIKTAIIAIVALSIPFVTSFFTTLKKIEITFNLQVIIGAVALIVVLILVIVLISKRNKALKAEINELKNENYELQHPANPNVNKFSQGEIVIRKIETENSAPEKLSVVSITRSEIECRKTDGQILRFSPEELLTAYETEKLFDKNKRENREFWHYLNKY